MGVKMDPSDTNADILRLCDDKLSKEEIERELAAHKELEDFAAALKLRKEKQDALDSADVIVDNNLMIEKVD